MQDFLAGGVYRGGDYTELQIGPARTQMQTFPLPANSEKRWTEYFKGYDGDKNLLLNTDYSIAVSHINQLTEDVKYNDVDKFLISHSKKPVSKILVKGQPWGKIEEILNGKEFLKSLKFDLPSDGQEGYDEASPWIELLQNGKKNC